MPARIPGRDRRPVLRPGARVVRDERCDTVEDVTTVGRNRLGRLQREAADEDGEPAEQRLLRGREQVVAPGDRVAHRPLPGSGRSRAAAGQQRQPPLQPGQERRRRQKALIRAAASSIASGSPSSRRQIAATAAAFSRSGRSRAGTARARSTNSRTRSGLDQPTGVSTCRPVPAAPAAAPRISCSPETRSRTRLVTSTFRLRAGRQQVRHERRRLDHLLEVVEHQQQVPVAQGRGQALEQTTSRCSRHAERLGDGGGDQVGVASLGPRGTRRPPVGEVRLAIGRHPQGEPGLADPPGPVRVTSRHHRAAEGGDGRHLALPADKAGQWNRPRRNEPIPVGE